MPTIALMASGNNYQVLSSVLQVLVLQAVVACSTPTPHEAFKINLQAAVGSRTDKPNMYMLPSELVSRTPLSHDMAEYVYQYSVGCKMIFTVDERAHLIIRASFEGDEKSCAWVP